MANPILPELRQQAIAAALAANWDEALKINQLIIDEDPHNVDALNRIARAYFEIGKLSKAKAHYERALKNDPYNQIAYKFLKRIASCKNKGTKSSSRSSTKQHNPIITDLFIEEPGKTKLVTLLKVAEPQKLSLLSTGTGVKLVAKNRSVVVVDQSGDYLGILPDDIAHRLIRFMKGGNRYQALIKAIKHNSLSILIRELFRSSRFKNQPSFLDLSSGHLTYSSDHIVVADEAEGSSVGESYDEENEVT